MRTSSSTRKDREVELVDGVKVHARRRLGAGAARPRGADHPRLGRGRLRRRRPPARPGVRPAHPPDAPLTGTGLTGDRLTSLNVTCRFLVASAPVNVPDDLRYSTDHEWVKRRGRAGPHRHHRLRARRARRRRVRRGPRGRRDGRRRASRSARSSPPSRCPTSTRRSRARSSRSTPTWPTPRAAERGPLRRGLALRDRDQPTRPRSTRCSTPPPTGRSSRAEARDRWPRARLQRLRAPQPPGLELLLVVRRASLQKEEHTDVFHPDDLVVDPADDDIRDRPRATCRPASACWW